MHGIFNSANAGAQAGTSRLAPNLADISAHLHALFEPDFVHSFPDAWIEIAFCRPDKKLNKAEIFSAFDLEGAAKFAFDTNKLGYNIYIGAALRHGQKPKSGRANDTHFLAARYCWAEYDNTGDHERITAICKAEGLQPAFGVVTGTVPHQRVHIYVLNAQPITEADENRSCNKALKERFDSDDVDNPSRVMRLAGTVNYPKADKRLKGYPPVKWSSILLATSSQTDANSSSSFLTTGSSACSASFRNAASVGGFFHDSLDEGPRGAGSSPPVR